MSVWAFDIKKECGMGEVPQLRRRTVCGVSICFRCESAVLHTYWVLVVMDQCTRRIVGCGVHRGVVDGAALCRMFNRATRCQPPPTYLRSDHDPLRIAGSRIVVGTVEVTNGMSPDSVGRIHVFAKISPEMARPPRLEPARTE